MILEPKWGEDVMLSAGRLALGTRRSLNSISRELGVPAGTIGKWSARWGWRERGRRSGRLATSAWQMDAAALDRAVLASMGQGAGAIAAERDRHPADRAGPDETGGEPVAVRLEAATLRAIAALEREIVSGRPLDPERTAKALASMAGTLKAVAGLARERTDEPQARPLAELLAELEGHRRRLRTERRAGGGGRRMEPA